MKQCKCDMRTKLVGDGCEVCNPDLAKELSTTNYRLVPVEDIEDLEKARLELHRAMEALNIHTALYSHISEPMWIITHRKYEEVEK